MHVAQKLPEGHVVFEIKNVAKRVDLRRVLIEHQQHACERQHDEQIESDTTHAPGVLVADRVAINLCRMEMQEYVRGYGERTIARIGTSVRDAKNGFPELRILNVFIALGLFDGPLGKRGATLFHFSNEARSGFLIAG